MFIREVVGFEELYSITSTGILISYNKNKQGRIMTPYDLRGYRRISLCRSYKYYGRFIHRLVAEAFLCDWDPDLQVNHKDFNRSNNNIENLEMCTGLQNTRHALEAGRKKSYKNIGEWYAPRH